MNIRGEQIWYRQISVKIYKRAKLENRALTCCIHIWNHSFEWKYRTCAFWPYTFIKEKSSQHLLLLVIHLWKHGTWLSTLLSLLSTNNIRPQDARTCYSFLCCSYEEETHYSNCSPSSLTWLGLKTTWPVIARAEVCYRLPGMMKCTPALAANLILKSLNGKLICFVTTVFLQYGHIFLKHVKSSIVFTFK